MGQERVDEAVLAAGWAIVEPGRNRELAELAVQNTGLGNVSDKITKNHNKTLGLLRDLQGEQSVGVVKEYPELGLIKITRPVGGIVRLNRTCLRKSRHSRILTSIKTTPLGKSGFAVLLKIVSTVDVAFLIKVVVN